LWELNNQNPLFEFRHFANKLFTYSLIVRFFSFFGYAATFFILPFYIQDVKGYGADVVGIVLFTGPAGLGIGSLISGRFDDKRILLIFLGLTLATIANILFILALWMDVSTLIFAGANLIAGLGFGIWLTPLWALSLASTDKSSYSLGAAIQNLVRNTSQLFAIAAATAIITSIMIAGGFVGDLSEIANDPTGNTASSFILGAQIVFFLSAVFGVGTMFATILVRKHEPNE
jgi:MFS family permease